MKILWVVVVLSLTLVACGGSGSESADEPDHVLRAQQRALDDARSVGEDARERVDRMERALEEALEEKDPAM